MKNLTVYSMIGCSFCEAAKQLLTRRNIPFQEVVLKQDDELQWKELFKRSGMKTVPQIFSGDTLIGGYTDLEAIDKKDQLESLKAA
ncbi:MAG: glutaredoxin domain-containing protein [Bacteriovoracia bacterium]